jgi:hypothetical protein
VDVFLVGLGGSSQLGQQTNVGLGRVMTGSPRFLDLPPRHLDVGDLASFRFLIRHLIVGGWLPTAFSSLPTLGELVARFDFDLGRSRRLGRLCQGSLDYHRLLD